MNLVVIDNSSDSTSSPFRRCKGSLESSRANTLSSSGDVGFQQGSQGAHLNTCQIWIRKCIKTIILYFNEAFPWELAPYEFLLVGSHSISLISFHLWRFLGGSI